MVPPLDFPDRSFDCVISFQVIEHIKRDAEFVREIHRVLRPGGRFIVTTPNAPMSLTRNPWHRMNRCKLLRENTGLTTSIRMDDYRIEPVGDGCFDLFYIAVK